VSYTPKNILDKLLRNKEGKLILWQFPNTPLFGWLIFTLLASIFEHGRIHGGFRLLAQTFLFVWAYFELTSGDTIFRKVLGTIVLIYIVLSLFR
jgi:hypothetical protein